jgi:hypothetical protein
MRVCVRIGSLLSEAGVAVEAQCQSIAHVHGGVVQHGSGVHGARWGDSQQVGDAHGFGVQQGLHEGVVVVWW